MLSERAFEIHNSEDEELLEHGHPMHFIHFEQQGIPGQG